MSEKNSQAFEYVLGVLSKQEREAFEARLQNDQSLKDNVHFWEDELSELNDMNDTLMPKENTWASIQAAIDPSSAKSDQAAPALWRSWLPWGLSAALSVVLMVTLLLGHYQQGDEQFVPVDYVAVLTGDQGDVMLTAVTEADSKSMWLQWETLNLESDQDLQIWAVSKSDKQVRSVAIIENTEVSSLTLSDAHWRLIKDADSLLLTVEEEGGSVLDEPSEIILAKGLCVRLNRNEKAG